MLDGQRKSVQPMAERLPDGNMQALQQFVNQSPWDPLPVRRRLAERPAEVITPEVWVADDVSFPKCGTASVGVARQYCGAVGKRASCQVAVSAHAAINTASCPLNRQLYLPCELADAPEVCVLAAEVGAGRFTEVTWRQGSKGAMTSRFAVPAVRPAGKQSLAAVQRMSATARAAFARDISRRTQAASASDRSRSTKRITPHHRIFANTLTAAPATPSAGLPKDRPCRRTEPIVAASSPAEALGEARTAAKQQLQPLTVRERYFQ